MRRTGLVLAAAAVALASCRESKSVGPAPTPDLALTGAWGTVSTSAGDFVEFSMRAVGGEITGAGREFRLGSFYDSLSIGGTYSETSGSFTLAITYSNGATASYTAVVLTPSLLAGTWTEGPFNHEPFDRDFYMRPQAPCADSAPLYGAPDYRAPGYLVQFHDSVDAAAEAARLGNLYHFTPGSMWDVGIKGFYAAILPTTAAQVRCDPVVEYMEYDQIAVLD